jgi:hypothetical protein
MIVVPLWQSAWSTFPCRRTLADMVQVEPRAVSSWLRHCQATPVPGEPPRAM